MRSIPMIAVLALILLCASLGRARASEVTDSLLLLVETSITDTAKVRWLNELAYHLHTRDPQQALRYARQAEQLAVQIEDERRIPESLNNIGIAYWQLGSYETAMQYLRKALLANRKTQNEHERARSYDHIGLIYDDQGNDSLALSYFVKALKVRESKGEQRELARSFNVLSRFYWGQENYKEALSYVQKRFSIEEALNNKPGMAACYSNMGALIGTIGNSDQAIAYFNESLEINRAIAHKKGIAGSCNNLALIYHDLGQYGKSMEYFEEALQLLKELNYRKKYANTLHNTAETKYEINKNYQAAIGHCNDALNIAQEVGSKSLVRDIYKTMARISKRHGNFKETVQYMHQYNSLKDSLMNEERIKQVAEIQVRYETEKKERELKASEQERQLQSVELEKKQLIVNVFFGGGGVLLLLLFLLYSRYTNKVRANNTLLDKNEEIEQHKRNLTAQNEKIEKNRNEILDSITYAKRIQNAIMLSPSDISKTYPNVFVYFKPKDIVSGDFYWLSKFTDYSVIGVIDCTGHGVPGAFITMIGYNLLNEIVNKKRIRDTSRILDLLDKGILKMLKQGEYGYETDGMDLTICVIDHFANRVQFSGARNHLYLVVQGSVETIKADMKSIGDTAKIGGKIDPGFSYSSTTIDITEPTTLYLTSDGYLDQFGGKSQRRKYGRSQFRELLLALHPIDLQEQHRLMTSTIKAWMQDYKQIDDQCVVGIQLNPTASIL